MSEWIDLAALVGWLLACIFWIRLLKSRSEIAERIEEKRIARQLIDVQERAIATGDRMNEVLMERLQMYDAVARGVFTPAEED
jgi:hypothetical protein